MPPMRRGPLMENSLIYAKRCCIIILLLSARCKCVHGPRQEIIFASRKDPQFYVYLTSIVSSLVYLCNNVYPRV